MNEFISKYNNCIIYDGDCPFCRKFVTLIDLRKTIPDLKLISARNDQQLVKELLDHNYDLNIGMMLIYNYKIYYKDECVNMVSKLTARTNIYNKFIATCFKNKTVSALIYPILRAGRRVWLYIKGIPLIK